MANASCANCTLVSNVLTLVGSVSGTVLVGMTITGASVAPGVTITSNGTGSGGAGTYNCSASATNIPTSEAMVFSLSWDMPLQGNSSFPQLADLGRAAGFGFIVAAAFGGGTAGPGQEYQFGTHQVAIYNDISVQGTNVWPPSPGRQGQSVAKWIPTLPQYPEPIAPQIFDTADFEKATGYQPLHLITAAPQSVDLTVQPLFVATFESESFGWSTEYQFGTHQKALYDSQIQGQVFGISRTPPSVTTIAPLRLISTLPQELSRDLTIPAWSSIPSVPQGWIITMITAGPQFADLTVQATLAPAQPFHSAFTGPTSPKTIVAVWQQDITQIPAQTQAPPLRKPAVQPLQQIIAAPDRQDYTQVQGQVLYTSLPGPSKRLQPAFVWSFEQQYDKTNFPQLVTPLIPTPPPPPPNTGFRVVAVTAGYYAGVYRTAGDVFDIAQAADYSDSTVDYQINSNNIGYGWMLRVAQNTPLVNWLDSNNAPYLPPQDPLRKFIT